MELFSKEFMSQYLWLIIIGVIVILALIGFIADKLGFLKKSEEHSDNSKDNDKKENEANYNKGLNDAVVDTVKNDEDIFNSFNNEEVKSEVKEISTPLEENIPSELYAPLEDKKSVVKSDEKVSNEKVVDFSDDEVWKF